MNKTIVLRLVALVVLSALLTACGAIQKTQIVQISSKNNSQKAIMKSVKCAIQQAGWNITYSDDESVSAGKAYGMDKVPCTLNIRLEEKQNSTTKAIFTVSNPRGVYGPGDYYTRDVVKALQECGAKGLVLESK